LTHGGSAWLSRVTTAEGSLRPLFAAFYDLPAVRWMKSRMFRFEIAETINVPW
jgi:hypothetical protein